MSLKNKEFKEGLKATSLFGGVQIFSILISVVKSKLVAVLLGPEGMGIQGILDSTTSMISGFTSLGLGTSAVKDISEAYASGNTQRIGRTLTVLRRLVWLTGMFGFMTCLMLSPILSKISFDTYDYTISFAAISVTLLFIQLSAGRIALLQGTKHFGYMAKASILGSILGLFTSIPLYYFLGYDGIVPAIIISATTALLLSWHFSRKVSYEKSNVSYKVAIKEGKGMAKMGFFISLQAFLSLLSSYLIRIFISRIGGVADVGLYVAGFAIVGTYMGLVFSSMAAEYYPRLSSHNNGTALEFNDTINQQIEISIILISPLICAFLIFGNLAVTLFYSEKFEPVTMMLCFAIISNYFKAPSWCIAFSFLAKGDSKAFLINELLSTIIYTSLQLIFFYWLGLTGVGIAFLLNYIIYYFQVSIICHYKYDYKINLEQLNIFIPQVILGLLCFWLYVYMAVWIRYVFGGMLILLSAYLSYRELGKHFDVVEALKARIAKHF